MLFIRSNLLYILRGFCRPSGRFSLGVNKEMKERHSSIDVKTFLRFFILVTFLRF